MTSDGLPHQVVIPEEEVVRPAPPAAPEPPPPPPPPPLPPRLLAAQLPTLAHISSVKHAFTVSQGRRPTSL